MLAYAAGGMLPAPYAGAIDFVYSLYYICYIAGISTPSPAAVSEIVFQVLSGM